MKKLIYGYSLPALGKEWIKIGMTDCKDTELPENAVVNRIKQQSQASATETISVLFWAPVLSPISDHTIHEILESYFKIDRYEIHGPRVDVSNITFQSENGNWCSSASKPQVTKEYSRTEFFKIPIDNWQEILAHSLELAHCDLLSILSCKELQPTGIDVSMLKLYRKLLYYLVVCEQEITSTEDLLRVTNVSLLEHVLAISLDEFNQLMTLGKFGPKERLDRCVQAFHKVKKFLGVTSNRTIDGIRGRQKLFCIIPNPSDDCIFPPLEYVKETINSAIPTEVLTIPQITVGDCQSKNGMFLSELVIVRDQALKHQIADDAVRLNQILNTTFGFEDGDNGNSDGVILSRWLLYGNALEKGNIDNTIDGCHDGKFDIMVINPNFSSPDQKSKKGGNKSLLWPQAIIQHTSYLKRGGHALILIPRDWRRPRENPNKEFQILMSNQINTIRMYSVSDCLRLFSKGTTIDLIGLEKLPPYKETAITDIEHNVTNLKVAEIAAITNGSFDLFEKILTTDSNNQIKYKYKSTPHTTSSLKKGILIKSKVALDSVEFPIPCLGSGHNDTKFYCSQKSWLTNIAKFLISRSHDGFFVDDAPGKWDTTEHCVAIWGDNEIHHNHMRHALNSKKWKAMWPHIIWSQYEGEIKVFRLLRKDFWKFFVDEHGNELV